MELLKECETKKVSGGAHVSSGIIVIIAGAISAILGFIDGISNPISCNARRYTYYN